MNYLIASHGKYAEGMANVAKRIIGNNNVYVVNAYLTELSLQDLLGQVPLDKGEWIICTDILGGSVNQEMMRNYCNERLHVIAGINVDCLLHLLQIENFDNLDQQIKDIVENSKNRMVFVNDIINHE